MTRDHIMILPEGTGMPSLSNKNKKNPRHYMLPHLIAVEDSLYEPPVSLVSVPFTTKINKTYYYYSAVGLLMTDIRF